MKPSLALDPRGGAKAISVVSAIVPSLAIPTKAGAVESTFMLYALGSGAVGAGQTLPDGFYFTTIASYGQWKTSRDVPFAGTTISANIAIPALSGNMMFVIPDKILGGRLAISATAGLANMRVDASAVGGVNAQRAAQGWGGTDTAIQASLGWDISETFSHKVTLTQWLPTGRYDKGFYPNIGLNRVGADISWGVTLIEPTTMLEFSGTTGFTIEGYNGATAYRSGNAVHFEEGVTKHFENGFRIGVISYQYRQLVADGGTGATLPNFRTSAVGVGPSAGYVTSIGGHLVAFGVQATREAAVKNRLRQTCGLFSTTVKF